MGSPNPSQTGADTAPKAATNHTKPRDNPAKFRSSLTDAQRQLALELLSREPPMPPIEVARELGCNPQVIYRLTRKDIPLKLDRSSRYRRRLDRELPIRERAELWAKIARGTHPDPGPAVRALERFDEVTALVSKTVAMPAPQPMFTLGDEVSASTRPRVNPPTPDDRVTVDTPAVTDPGNTPGSGYQRTVKGSGPARKPKLIASSKPRVKSSARRR